MGRGFEEMVLALRRLRKGLERKPEDVAEAVGVEASVLEAWEGGEEQPTIEELFAWLDALGTPLMDVGLMVEVNRRVIEQVRAGRDEAEAEEMSMAYVSGLVISINGVLAGLKEILAGIERSWRPGPNGNGGGDAGRESVAG